MKTSSQIIGKISERVACDYLEHHGLQLIAANYQCKCGEIDLIMQDGEILVFVEVRYRKDDDYGDGIATVTKFKQHKIIKAAIYYLQQHDLYDKVSCRFDVVGSSGGDGDSVQWIKDAFWVKW